MQMRPPARTSPGPGSHRTRGTRCVVSPSGPSREVDDRVADGKFQTSHDIQMRPVRFIILPQAEERKALERERDALGSEWRRRIHCLKMKMRRGCLSRVAEEADHGTDLDALSRVDSDASALEMRIHHICVVSDA